MIGKKYTITCQLDGVKTRALWDTGSQVCLINEKWRQQNIPHTTVRSISEILGPATLDGRAVNQTPIPFSGWVEVKFKLPTEEATQLELLVPVLVAQEDGVAKEPFIGFNVIEYLLERGIEPPHVVTEAVRSAFSFDCRKAEVFVEVMKSGEDRLGEGTVKAGRELTAFPAGPTKAVKCSVRAGPLSDCQDVLVEPDVHLQLPEGLEFKKGVVSLQRGPWSCITIPITNNTTHDILLPPRTVLGQTQMVKTVYPADTRPVEIIQTQTMILTTDQTVTNVTEEQRTETENRKSTDSEDSWALLFPSTTSP